MRRRVFVRLSMLSLLVIGCGPIVMIPGGTLSGDVTAIPKSWTFLDDVETIQLETRPTDPYSVNLWAVEFEGAVYVVAGSGPQTTWAQHIQDDPRVRLRVNRSIYELRAVEANNEGNRELFLAAAKKKYDFEPESEDVSKAVLYRLDPR